MFIASKQLKGGYFFTSLFFLLLVSLHPSVSLAQNPDFEETIKSFDVLVHISQDSRVTVEENIRYDFGTNVRHGIFRYIPTDYQTSLGIKKSLALKVRSVTDGDGNPYPYEVETENGRRYVKIGNPDETISGEHTYIITYTARNTIGYFEKFDEFYWNVTGNEWLVPIERASVRIYPPRPILNGEVSTLCFRGVQGSTLSCGSQEVTLSENKTSMSYFGMTLSQPLMPKEGMTIVLAFPKDIVDEPSWWEVVGYFLLENPFIVLPFAVFGFMFRRWWRDGRDPKGRGTVVPEYDVPDGFSPLHIAALQDGRLTGKEIPAAIIDLAVKGYLVIERVADDGIVFDTTDYTLLETDKRPAAGSIESALIEALFTGARSSVDTAGVRKLLASPKTKLIPDFLKRSIEASLPKEAVVTETAMRSVKVSELKNKFYTQIPALQKRAVSDLVARRYFVASPQEVWGKYILWGMVILFVSFFILPIFQLGGANIIALLVTVPIYFVFAYLMPRVTHDGAIAKEHLLGLKDYLQIAEKRRIEFHNAPEKTPELFERLLPAALLLGVSDIWAKEFTDLTMAEPEWYRGGNISSFSAASLATDLGGFNMAAGSSLASAPSSSGSGGGGFSGGGGGGGGGGSW